MRVESPLVSIVMPTYKLQYLEQALDSVLGQRYPALELIVCDDSPDDRIEALVERKRIAAPFPVRYFKNTPRLGETPSTAKGIRLAKGKYIKFLHDDDVLLPDCVARLVEVMERHPQVSLVSSRRQRIDEAGERLSDILHTSFPFPQDALVDGRELTSFLVDHTINFIGEPSCVMCRREHLLEIGGNLMTLNGTPIHWVGDLALYVQLLQRGDLAFLAEPLTQFRVSAEQFSQFGRDNPGVGDKGHADFCREVRALGWYRTRTNTQLVRVAPLAAPADMQSVDLIESLKKAHAHNRVEGQFLEWMRGRRPTLAQQRHIRQRFAEQPRSVSIGIWVVDRHGDSEALKHSLDSTLRTAGDQVAIEVVTCSVQAADLNDDPRCTFVHWDGAELASRLNTWLQAHEFDWVLLLDAGDQFTPSGLTILALELIGADTVRAVYTDLVLRAADGSVGPAMRPDFNLDLLLSCPTALARHCVFRREAVLTAGGFSALHESALETELLLRLVEQGGLDGLAHLSEPLLVIDAPELVENPDEKDAIERHLRARGYLNAQVMTPLPGRYHIDYGHAEQPLVSILVLMRDQLAAAQRCVMSILEQTRYPRYEVLIVDNASETAAAKEWLSGIEQMGASQVRVLRSEQKMDTSTLSNLASQHAQGDYLLLLSPECAVFDGAWLDEMVNHAQRPEVGIVGAKTVSAEGTITHAGLILGLQGVAGNAFFGEPMESPGYMNRLQVAQNFSAVSGNCLMVRKSLYQEAGGLDQETYAERGADIDLCLRITGAGYLVVWTPHAVLLHNVKPQGQTIAYQDLFYERWLPRLAKDPAYNPNFSLIRAPGGFALTDTNLTWKPLTWHPVPVVAAHFADTFGCGNYRIIQPFTAQKEAGLIEGFTTANLLHVADYERYSPDVVVLQRQVEEERLEAMRRLKAFSRAFKVYELDDYLPNLPLKSYHRQHMPKDIVKSLRRGLGYVDRFVVSTEVLAEAFAGWHDDIRVVENRLDPRWWGRLPQSRRRTSAKPRVGWAGGSGHTGDLDLIADVVKALAGEVDWVFFGMCPESLKPYVAEFHPGVDIELYPAKLARLHLDLALAPLEQNLFNEGKSNLRLLEYGICGFPVVCSDLRCYAGDLPVTRVKNRYLDWVEAIRMHLADMDATARMGDALREQVRRDWMLDGENLQAWFRAWQPD